MIFFDSFLWNKLIPNKICIVTEFVQFGNIQNVMNKGEILKPRLILRTKILSDCAKGIQYLHDKNIKEMIEQSWCDDPKERLTIEDIVSLLETSTIKFDN